MPDPIACQTKDSAMPRSNFAAIAIGASALFAVACSPASGEAPQRIPAPAQDISEAGPNAVAQFAGGCFWGVSAVFDHVVGVRNVTAGYAGGTAIDASYDRVITETTNHAETIRIVYDPSKVSYGRLLQIYFAVAHDPTQLNRQFPDSGRSYRSAIFPQSPAQQQLATAYIAQLNAARVFKRPIVTRLERGTFYPAEAYHQHYLAHHPESPYIQAYDIPKVRALQTLYPQLYR